MTRAASALAALALAGCAAQPPLLWYKDGSTREDFERQKAKCSMQVYQLPPMPGAMPWQVAGRNNEFFGQCMRADGWVLR